MTETIPERDDDRFEEVLGRLDALVKRGQRDEEPLPPPVVAESEIPVLTEVFSPGQVVDAEAIPLLADTLIQEQREPSLDAMLPLMVKVMEDALVQQVQPALEEVLRAKIKELRPQLDMLLRQHLQSTLVQEEHQTEE